MQSFVECYSGLMGGGKSFSATHRMLDHISGGGVVYSNIKLELEPWFNSSYAMKEFSLPVENDFCKRVRDKSGIVPLVVETENGSEWVYNSRGARDFLRRFRDWEYQEGQYNYISDDDIGPALMHLLPCGSVDRPVLVILDEALDHFESCEGNTTAQFRSFLRHVRKLGINLIFIAQDFGSMDKKIRSLTHYVWLFKDLKTWKVPIFGNVFALFGTGGSLPPPWCDNIHTRQFHQNQFGSVKADIINKNQYVYRDTFIFQCYQSVSLHNADLQMQGVAKDFGESGRIKKGKKTVKPIERILIYTLLAVALWLSVKRPAVVSADSVPAPVPVALPAPLDTEKKSGEKIDPEKMVSFSYVDEGEGVVLVTMQGKRRRDYRLGAEFDGRQIVAVSDHSVVLRSEGGEVEKLFFD